MPRHRGCRATPPRYHGPALHGVLPHGGHDQRDASTGKEGHTTRRPGMCCHGPARPRTGAACRRHNGDVDRCRGTARLPGRDLWPQGPPRGWGTGPEAQDEGERDWLGVQPSPDPACGLDHVGEGGPRLGPFAGLEAAVGVDPQAVYGQHRRRTQQQGFHLVHGGHARAMEIGRAHV